MVFCSSVYQQCQPAYTMTESYNNWYECMVAGYDEAKRKTIQVGKEQVNKDGIYIKFYCTLDKRPRA